MHRIHRLLLLLAGLSAAGCQTSITFENQVPGVVVHDVRFVAADSKTEPVGPLLPGESAEEVIVFGEGAGESGTVMFELDLAGRRIHLEVERRFDPKDDEASRFVLRPDTAVRSPLLAEAPLALWVEGE